MSQLFKITALFYGLLISCKPVFCQTQKKRLQASITTLLSVEQFRWSIAGNDQGTHPDILSELRFSKLKRTGLCLEGSYQFSSRMALNISAGRQYGFSGRVTDIDYAGDNRSLPVALHKFRSRRNNTGDYQLQYHYQVLRGPTVAATILAGYFISKADYQMLDRSRTNITGIYNAQWRGPLLGTELRIALPQNWEILAGINGQRHIYKASANWIYRTDFSHPLSFIHQASGQGLNGLLALNYQPGLRVGLQLRGTLQHWKTGNGSDLLYMADGREVSTRMNESVKTQMGIGLRGIFRF